MTFFQIAVFTKGNNLVLSVNELSPTSHLVIHRQVAATAKSLPNCSLGIAIHVTAVSHLYSTVGQVSRLFVYTYLHFQNARLILQEGLERIPPDRVLYCDTVG